MVLVIFSIGIWEGIATEKKLLLEEEDGYVVFNETLKVCHMVCVVMDSLISCLYESEVVKRNIMNLKVFVRHVY